ENYDEHVRVYIAPHRVGATPLQVLTGGHITALYVDMTERGLSAATIGGTHRVIHKALNDAVKWGRVLRNPAKGATVPKAKRAKVKAWSERELRRFLAYVAEHDRRLYALCRLGATTGMRRGELLGLPLRNLDLDGGRVQIFQQLIRTEGTLQISPVKNPPKGERTISLDPRTVEILRNHVESQRLERDLAGETYEDNDLVFCNEGNIAADNMADP